MDESANDLMLLERVFLRLGSAETDDQLENILSKFLVPVLLKLASTQEAVRKKVMELLLHVNKRTKTRPAVQLPVDALLAQYQDPTVSSFVANFTIIYIRSGFPRLSLEKQVELVPTIINALDGKPVTHLDSLLLLIVPLLGKVQVPTEPEKIQACFGLNQHPIVSKHLRELLLDVILLPYSSLNLKSQQTDSGNVAVPTPPGMTEASFKRVTANDIIKPDEFETVKLGVVKFLSRGVFKSEDILIHFIVAASDTRFEVANFADMELKKILGFVEWSSPRISQPLFILFLGAKSNRPEQVKIAANTRIRLKLLTHLCRVQGEGFMFPFSLQIIFDSLYGENTNNKLKSLALNFAANLVRYSAGDSLKQFSPLLLTGLTKMLSECEDSDLLGQVYVTIGLLVQKYPHIVFNDVGLLQKYFDNLEAANPNLKIQVREGFLNLIQAYKYDVIPDQVNKDDRLTILFALIKVKMASSDGMVRFACVRTLTTIFPPDDVPSKFLLLVAVGDSDADVRQEAFKSIYGTSRHTEFDMTKASAKMPSFQEMASYVHIEATSIMSDKGKIIQVGNHALPFNVKVYLEILLYLRLCLLRSLDVSLTREVLKHPCEHSPKVVKCIRAVYKDPVGKVELANYLSMIKTFMFAQLSVESISCLIEIIGAVPEFHSSIADDIHFVRDQIGNVKEDVREYISILYSLLLSQSANDQFDSAINYLIEQTAKNNLETQHGSLLAIGYCLEAYALKRKEKSLGFDKNELVKECLNTIAPFLSNKNNLLMAGATISVGLIGRVIPLPVEDGKIEAEGSPNPKKQAIGITKLDLVESILEIMNNGKLSVKIRERAARALGLLCVGERFIHTKLIMEGLLGTSKDTKDVEVHFTIGESLLMCCQNTSSPEARNAWKVSIEDCTTDDSDPTINQNLEWFLDQLLKLAAQPHPNTKQASAIWLLAVLKGCGKREPISNRVQIIQNTFMNFLCENSDIVQDVAAKGLCVIYDSFKSEELLTALVNQLTLGTRNVTQVTSDTKLFQEGQLGTAPTGENLTTYKELCSLASDLNKPDLIYKFMHLANHNAMWNSKKGAAFGFSTIAQKCSEDLKKLMPEIVPKLYRYQFDPTPNIHDSMANIWRVLVTDSQSALDTYYHEILKDLLANINSAQYRVRQSCCIALQDFLKGSSHRSIHDAVDYMDELWGKLFRVMDDHHENTRMSAINTARVLSKLCIRASESSQGKAGVKMMESLLPILLNTGITHTVAEIRVISLQTVSELVNSAGNQIKPFLPQLIPALLQATGELESSKLSYLSTMMGAQSETQEVIDSARASIAKSHFATETVSKSLRYLDSSMLTELIPKVLELMKSSVGLGTKVACAHFITLLVVELKADVQPFSGKLLSALVNGLTDRNSAVRKHYAAAIGHLVGVCKPASLEKLFAKLNLWYFEREDDSVRSAIAHTIQSIGIHNQEVIKSYSTTVLPLVFFATHVDKTPETQHTLNIWVEIWSEHSPGTESGIRNNIVPICGMLRTALESPSWTVKAQAANAVSTVATKLGSTMEVEHVNSMLMVLLTGLNGKTWKGKDKLLKALKSICSSCKTVLISNVDINTKSVIDAICREARKQEISYKIAALECLGDVVSALETDVFEDVYEIVEAVLTSSDTKKEDADEDETKKNRDNAINLKIAAYETLGKVWPEKSPTTQEKYRDLFVTHCVKELANSTRSIQISILSALYNFVNKLSLLQKNNENLTATERGDLKSIVDKLIEAISYAFSVAKNTRLRKEALNIVFYLTTKLKEQKNEEVLKTLTDMFSAALEVLSTDSQPEIKCRLHDIKQIMY